MEYLSRCDINTFEKEFQKLHDISISLPEKIKDAIELFNLTKFNLQPKIKFLLYVIVIESLKTTKKVLMS